MSFTSPVFYVFLAGVIALCALLRHRWQNRVLLAASYAFYASWNPSFTIVLLLTTMLDYYCGMRIAGAALPAVRRRFLLASIAANLLVLAVFKYGNAFIAGYNAVWARADGALPWHILFPIGISFYIFQSLAYTIDIYRGVARPAGRFTDYALYVSFFPQLLAGPIARPGQLLPQIEAPRRFTAGGFAAGGHLIFWGLFQKLFVADSCAVIADTLLARPFEQSGAALLVGMYAYAFRVFADISGYTDIARGAAKCLGFDLPINFHLPYFAGNISNFWQRWHISVTAWFRDYVFFPLLAVTRGNAYVSAFAVLLCIALWHSASVNSVFRGVYFGLAVVLYHALQAWLRRAVPGAEGTRRPLPRWRTALGALVTFHVVCVGWLFLLPVPAADVPRLVLRVPQAFVLGEFWGHAGLLLRYLAPLLLVQAAHAWTRDELFILKTGFWPRTLFYLGLFLLLYGASGGILIQPFLYFRY